MQNYGKRNGEGNFFYAEGSRRSKGLNHSIEKGIANNVEIFTKTERVLGIRITFKN